MITIGPAFIEKGDDNYSYLKCKISTTTESSIIWYRTTLEYADSLCSETSDPFIVLMIMPAIQTGEEIYVDGLISKDTFFNLTNRVIPLLSSVYQTNGIKIHAKQIIDITYSPTHLGCGCSLGVDSLSAIYRYISSDVPKPFQLTCLTYFNIGALGENDFNSAHESFANCLKLVQSFADTISLPLVTLESNSSLLFKDFDFEQTHSIRNVAAVMCIQKMMKVYYYASSYPMSELHLNSTSMSFYDSILLPMLSTKSLSFSVVDTNMTRVDKTDYIAQNELTRNFLFVCWKDIFSNGKPEYKAELSKINYINCTRCDKCLRTLYTLDLLGYIDQYDKLFDLEYYYTQKESYTYKILLNAEDDVMYKQIKQLMINRKIPILKKIQIKVWLYNHHFGWLWEMTRGIKRTLVK